MRMATDKEVRLLGQMANTVANPDGVRIFTKSYALNQVANFSEFTALYDKFRIVKVYMRITWQPPVYPWTTTTDPGLTSVQTYAVAHPTMRLWLLNDRDGDLGNYTESRLRQRRDVKVLTMNPNFKTKASWSVTPTINMAGFTEDTSGSATVRVQGRSHWLDCTQTTTQHYGTVIMADPENTGPDQDYNFGNLYIEYRYLLDFRFPQ